MVTRELEGEVGVGGGKPLQSRWSRYICRWLLPISVLKVF